MMVLFGCGRCQEALEGPADPKDDDVLTCPECGQADSFENVGREVGEFVQEQAAKALGAMLRGVAENSDALEFKEAVIPERTYRFVALPSGH